MGKNKFYLFKTISITIISLFLFVSFFNVYAQDIQPDNTEPTVEETPIVEDIPVEEEIPLVDDTNVIEEVIEEPVVDDTVSESIVEEIEVVEETLNEAPMMKMMLAPIGSIEVYSFDELKNAVVNAGTSPTTIIIKESITFSETININANQNITTVGPSENVEPILSSEIVLPNLNDPMSTKEQLVSDATTQGDIVIEKTNLTTNPVVKPSITLNKALAFTKEMFNVLEGGNLIIGSSERDSIFFDGTEADGSNTNTGKFINVLGNLTINGGTFANANIVKMAYSAPITVSKTGVLTMNAGRITSNKVNNGESIEISGGGVRVSAGGTFILNNGSIDNNTASAGGISVGDIGADSANGKTNMIMNGGIISSNSSSGPINAGGGIQIFPGSDFEMNDGIISDNYGNTGGGIFISDQYVTGYNGIDYSNTYSTPYEKYIEVNGTTMNMNGGLIYKNTSYSGGGIFVSTSEVKLNDGYLLDNYAYNMGGAIYVSIVPYVFELENALVSENTAYVSSFIYQFPGGSGGGFWNCPSGVVDYQDFGSVYVFNNFITAGGSGEDIFAYEKLKNYKLNGQVIGD